MSNSNNNTNNNLQFASLVDAFYPANEPLCAKYKQGFGYKTIGYRLPVILTKVIDQISRDKNEIGEKLGDEARAEVKDVVGALAKLKNEMVTNKPIQYTPCKVWNDYLDQVAKQYFSGKLEDVRWYVGPWLHVECYMYHRMNEAFRATKYLKTYDPFVKQKEEAFWECADAASILGEFVQSAEINTKRLQTLLYVSLWGNRCDLSISQGETNSQTGDIVDQLESLREKLLVDDSSVALDALHQLNAATTNSNQRSVGYVLDNSAFELFTDLCLADALLESKLADRVEFYVKAQPWFISDVLSKDFHWLLETMSSLSDKPVLSSLGSKWSNYVKTGRFAVIEKEFWTYPHSYNEMEKADPSLYSELSQKSLLIFKGDLNYRKLIGDIAWDFDTPFVKSLRGFTPAPLIALRTLKADCVSGLPTGVGEKLSESNHDWMNTGEYGVIQFVESPVNSG